MPDKQLRCLPRSLRQLFRVPQFIVLRLMRENVRERRQFGKPPPRYSARRSGRQWINGREVGSRASSQLLSPRQTPAPANRD